MNEMEYLLLVEDLIRSLLLLEADGRIIFKCPLHRKSRLINQAEVLRSETLKRQLHCGDR